MALFSLLCFIAIPSIQSCSFKSFMLNSLEISCLNLSVIARELLAIIKSSPYKTMTNISPLDPNFTYKHGSAEEGWKPHPRNHSSIFLCQLRPDCLSPYSDLRNRQTSPSPFGPYCSYPGGCLTYTFSSRSD